MAIHIITTGGTIDDLEYDSTENAPVAKTSLLPDLLNKARITKPYTIKELMSKDSRFINKEDRSKLARECITAPTDQIVISHGTLTMAETAKFLGEAKIPKTIVLFGAQIPANKPESDALVNLGAAVTSVQLLDPGVYITMNGQVFSWDNVRKNVAKGIFETED